MPRGPPTLADVPRSSRTSTDPYGVRLSLTAAKAFGKLPDSERVRVRGALHRLSAKAARPGRIGGKSVKSRRGTHDTFHRLRVGDVPVMYDVIEEDPIILILGIVHRGDLDRWLHAR